MDAAGRGTTMTDKAEITLRGQTFLLDGEEFAGLAARVDEIRRADLLAMPPFERLKEALEAAIAISEIDGDERQVWHLLIDRVNTIRASGLLEACRMEERRLMPIIDEGYREEVIAIKSNIGDMIRSLDKLIVKDEEPSTSRYW